MATEERQYRPGERVPGTEYVVVRLEAEGGHGALYLVKHHFLERKIQMLKTLRGFEPSEELIERLKREAQMLAAMDHPHIVSVTSGGITDEKNPRPYFVMERLKGRSLAQIVPEAPEGVGVDAALKVTIEVCDALEYVHTRHGVVHRDIKPDNVFLQVTPRNGSVTKILDFGVAHIMDLEKRYTQQNLFLGTPRYASPEQIMGDTPSPQTDLYAVGLLLYELLLGYGPFDDATNFASVATAHAQRPPPAFPKTRRFPDGLEEIVMSLLRKKATERPKSAEWLATQLRQIKRIAELAENADPQDLNKTEVSPMQNSLTGHRAQLTEAGVALPTPRARVEGASSAASTVSAVAPSSVDVPTSPGAPFGFRSTVRLETPVPPKPQIDRGAETRSILHVDLPARNRSDTEELPDARAWLPEGNPNATGPVSRSNEPVAQGGTSTTAVPPEASSEDSARGRRRNRTAAMVGVATGVGIVAVVVAVYATTGSRTRTPTRADTETKGDESARIVQQAAAAPAVESAIATPNTNARATTPASSAQGAPSALTTPQEAPPASAPAAAPSAALTPASIVTPTAPGNATLPRVRTAPSTPSTRATPAAPSPVLKVPTSGL